MVDIIRSLSQGWTSIKFKTHREPPVKFRRALDIDTADLRESSLWLTITFPQINYAAAY